MPVIAMTCVSRTPHEKTDTLNIYQFESPARGRLQIVANLTNVYEVGDVAAIALLGTRLPGVVLGPRKVYGIDSQGMALGKVVGAAPDADLTEEHNADVPASRYRVTVAVEVEAHYPEDAVELAAKAIGKQGGTAISTENLGPVAPDAQ